MAEQRISRGLFHRVLGGGVDGKQEPPPQTYWRVLKKRLLEEGDQTVAHMEAIEVQAIEEEGEARNTDAAE